MEQHCNQCDFDWESRVEEPRACPRCKRYDWREPKKSGGNHGLAEKSGAEESAEEVRPGGNVGGRGGGNSGFNLSSDQDVQENTGEHVAMCAYREYDDQLGEWFRCKLEAHGPKVKHQRGEVTG